MEDHARSSCVDPCNTMGPKPASLPNILKGISTIVPALTTKLYIYILLFSLLTRITSPCDATTSNSKQLCKLKWNVETFYKNQKKTCYFTRLTCGSRKVYKKLRYKVEKHSIKAINYKTFQGFIS